MNQILNKIERTEIALLAAFITSESCWKKKTVLLDDFREKKCRDLFKAMLKCEEDGIPPWDFLALDAFITPDLRSFVNDLTDGDMVRDGFNCAANIPLFEKALREKNNRAIVSEVLEDVGTSDPYRFVTELEGQISRMTIKPKPDHAKELGELYSELEALHENPEGLAGLPSGIGKLDDVLGGLREGNLYIVGARPSMGKSCFALNVALNVALKGKRVYIQSMEEPRKDLFRRLIANLSGVPLGKIMTGKGMTANDWSMINSANNTVSALDLVIDDDSGVTADEIVGRMAKAHNDKAVSLVIIDHLQEIYGTEREKNRHLEISRALHVLRAAIKRMSVPALVLCQINRAVEGRDQPAPRLADLKESGDIEAKADAVIGLYRPAYYLRNQIEKNGEEKFKEPVDDRQLYALVLKNRNGILGKIELDFDGAFMRVSQRESLGAAGWQGYQ